MRQREGKVRQPLSNKAGLNVMVADIDPAYHVLVENNGGLFLRVRQFGLRFASAGALYKVIARLLIIFLDVWRAE